MAFGLGVMCMAETKIVWSAAMTVGVPSLDRDHQTLISLIARIDAVYAGTSASVDAVEEILAALFDYTLYHFQREERLMEACAYPDLQAHKEEHALLTDEVAGLMQRFRRDPLSVTPGTLRVFLTEWLNHHIMLQDKAYQVYLEGNPAALVEDGDEPPLPPGFGDGSLALKFA